MTVLKDVKRTEVVLAHFLHKKILTGFKKPYLLACLYRSFLGRAVTVVFRNGKPSKLLSRFQILDYMILLRNLNLHLAIF